MGKRARRRIDGGDDRLSKLPEPILHDILSFLPQIDAVKTSVLSKPWRHLWTGRSKVDFCERECEPSFLSALDNTLKRYHDHKLCLQELVVRIYNSNPESYSLLMKWIPIVMRGDLVGVKKFSLSFFSKDQGKFDLFYFSESHYSQLPPQAFVSESSLVDNLSLRGCTLTQPNSIKLKHLQTLVLYEVYISEQTLDKILSSSSECCPLIQDVSVVRCAGFKRIKLLKSTTKTLKHFVFENRHNNNYMLSHIEIDENLPTIRSIKITGCSIYFARPRSENTYFSHHLTRLVLFGVRLPKLFSFDLPCLEEMRIRNCDGLDELQLSSISMKLLAVMNTNSSFKATIDAPSIQRFSYVGIVPQSISFTTPNIDHHQYWEESDIHIISYGYEETVALLWFQKLQELLQASSQARIITLRLHHVDTDWKRERKLNIEDDRPHDSVAAVEVEGLSFQSPGKAQLCNLSFPDFLKRLFRVCRPRYIGPYNLPPFLQEAEFLREKLIEERGVVCEHVDVLEEVSMEALYKSRAGWEPADSSAFYRNYQDPVEVRFPLKWRRKASSIQSSS